MRERDEETLKFWVVSDSSFGLVQREMFRRGENLTKNTLKFFICFSVLRMREPDEEALKFWVLSDSSSGLVQRGTFGKKRI